MARKTAEEKKADKEAAAKARADAKAAREAEKQARSDAKASGANSGDGAATPGSSSTAEGDRVTQPKSTVVPGARGHSVPKSQQYGETSQEEHKRSGYRYPESFYKKPIPAEERVEGGPMFEGEKKSRKSAPENKSATNTNETK